MRDRTIRFGNPVAECLNRRTSPVDDRCGCCCAPVLNARQTASPVTACLRTNVYLVMPATARRCLLMRTACGGRRRDGFGGMAISHYQAHELRYIQAARVSARAREGACEQRGEHKRGAARRRGAAVRTAGGAGGSATRRLQRRRQRQHRQQPGRRSRHRRFPDLLREAHGADHHGGQRCSRTTCASCATRCPSADLYMRASASPSAKETNITTRITAGAELGRQGRRYFRRRHAGDLRHARPARQEPGPEEGALVAHLAVHHRQRHAGAGDQSDHRPRSADRQRRLTALPARRAHRVFDHAPATVAGRPARRGQAAVLGAGRRPHRAGVRARSDERRRHRHPPDLLQPESRPRRHGAGERPRAVDAAGTTRPGRPQPDAPVLGQSRRHRPAAVLRRQQPRHRHQRQRHRVRASAPDAGRPHPRHHAPVHRRRRRR